MRFRTAVGVAFVLLLGSVGAQAQRAPRPTAHGPRLPWVDRWFVTSDSVRLHYLSGGGGTGAGPTIVFIPGWTMPADIWERQLRYFAPTTRVVALDPRSQGGSQRTADGDYTDRRARDIHELIGHLKVQKVVLVGWSMGVPEALEVVDQFGTQDIAGVVLVDNFVFVPPPFATFMDTLLYHVLHDRPVFTAMFVHSMYRTQQDSAYLARITSASLSVPTTTAYTLLSSTFANGRRDWRPALDKVDRPLLFVGSAAMREMADTVRNHVHDAHVEIFENAGHALFVDEPDHFNRVLEDFVKKLR